MDTSLSDKAKNAMERLFKILIELLQDEGLDSVDDDIVKNIEKAEKAATRDNDWSNAQTHLKKAVDLARPFDIEKLVQYYGEFTHVANKLRDGDLVLFIGRTCSGKSTTIDFLKWTKFERDPNHPKHFKPIDKASDELSSIKLNYQVSQSVTRYLTPVAISLDDLMDNNSKNGIIL